MYESEWNTQLKGLVVIDEHKVGKKIQTRRLVESRLGAETVLIGQHDSPLHLAEARGSGTTCVFLRERYSALR